jgi:Mg2+/Co2+ transporter CorB
MSDEELRGAIDLASGEENREEREMLHSILDLADVSVVKVMTYRRNVRMFDINMPARELVEDILATPYSRVPLWEKEPGNIIGVLHVRALVRALKDGNGSDSLDIRQLVTPPWFIPETANLLDQLQEFRKRREHFAMVVDEYGVFMGIITLEDILEEIVGQIHDEHDVPVAGVRHLADGHFIIPGTVPIRELNREYGWDLPEDPATTIAGLILHEARSIPDAGQVFRFHGFSFEVLRRQRHQITLLKVIPPARDTNRQDSITDTSHRDSN